jgi:hypothetical protein
LQILQTKPERYREFGVYWWFIKDLLKEYYTQDNLYLLGNFTDPDINERLPDVSEEELIQLAIQEHQQNAAYNLGRNSVYDYNGEPYVIYDEDTGV